MKIKFCENGLLVTRESGDKKYYGTLNAAGESKFLHDLKNVLNKKGFDLGKIRMWKHHHMVDDLQQYLFTKKRNSKTPHIYLYNKSFAICGLNDDFNAGEVLIGYEFDIYNKQPECYELFKKLLVI